MKIVRASTYIFLILLFANVVFAGLPPTTTKASGDASNFTTFKFLFPNFTVTRSGINTTFNVNSVAGGGTGLSSTTAICQLLVAHHQQARFRVWQRVRLVNFSLTMDQARCQHGLLAPLRFLPSQAFKDLLAAELITKI